MGVYVEKCCNLQTNLPPSMRANKPKKVTTMTLDSCQSTNMTRTMKCIVINITLDTAVPIMVVEGQQTITGYIMFVSGLRGKHKYVDSDRMLAQA